MTEAYAKRPHAYRFFLIKINDGETKRSSPKRSRQTGSCEGRVSKDTDNYPSDAKDNAPTQPANVDKLVACQGTSVAGQLQIKLQSFHGRTAPPPNEKSPTEGLQTVDVQASLGLPTGLPKNSFGIKVMLSALASYILGYSDGIDVF